MQSQKEILIKYDKYSLAIIKKMTIASTILFASGVFLMFIEINGAELFALFALFFGGGLAVFCYGALAAGHLYIKRLKRYGYLIPEKKREYDGKLENLPKISNAEETSLFSEHSKWGCKACVLMFIIFLILDMEYFLQWKFMGENCKAVFGMCLFFYLVWVIFALVLKKQSSKDKYRDDVEPDITRKERWSLEYILFTMVVLCLLSISANLNAHSMTKYIFRSMIDNDMVQASLVRNSVLSAISECRDENGNMTCKDTYDSLCEGVDITSWAVPKDEMQKLIAKNMCVEDFSLMRDDFNLSDGDAQIFVKIIDGKVTVRLLNPVKEVSRYGTRTKDIYVDSNYSSDYH